MPSLMKVIATELGVSNATVSRALNDQPGVSADLRERILTRAAALNMSSHTAARGLASAKTFTLGFFIGKKPGLSTNSDPFYGEMLHGVEQVVNGSDYHLAVAALDEEMLATPSTFRYVREQRVDGMLLAGPDIPAEFVLYMRQSGLPVVLIDNVLEFTPVDAVTSDDEGGAYQAGQYLLALDHRQIGIIAGPETWSTNQRRIRGYERALGTMGISPVVIHAAETTVESGQEAYRKLMSQAPDTTAIGAVNDSMAIGAMIAARKQGLHIPRDVSIIGFDNIAWGSLNDPPLTTLDVPKHQIGTEAARRLLVLLDASEQGIRQAATHLTLSVSFVERASCARKG